MSVIGYNYTIIDEEYSRYLNSHSEIKDHWMLKQTLYTGATRRELLATLSIPVNSKVIDLGAGFGALAIDMAYSMPIQVWATDFDLDKVMAAKEIAEQVDRKITSFKPGEINFQQENTYSLSFENSTFDYAVARFLFQHLSEPAKAIAEIQRVLKPDGVVCIIDVDESFAISYPDTPGYDGLYTAFKQLQQQNGGDRRIGRKLPHLLREAGFVEIYSFVQMQSAYNYTAKGNLAHQFVLEQFLSVRDEIESKGIMHPSDFDRLIEQYKREIDIWQFEASGQVVAFARKMN